jgi:hypothetical protein
MSQALVVLVLVRRRGDLANPVSCITLRDEVVLTLRCAEKLLMPCFQEKPLSYSL